MSMPAATPARRERSVSPDHRRRPTIKVMSSASPIAQSLTAAEAPPELVLEVWLAAEKLPWTTLAAAGVLAVAILAGVGSGSLLMGLLAGLIVLLSAWRYWLPIRYVLCPIGVTQTVLGRRSVIPWKAVGRIEVRQHGVLLLPRDTDAPLAKLRALHIPWAGQQQNLLSTLNHYAH